jgi:hypothetical protein
MPGTLTRTCERMEDEQAARVTKDDRGGSVLSVRPPLHPMHGSLLLFLFPCIGATPRLTNGSDGSVSQSRVRTMPVELHQVLAKEG